jgi:hypothetical protein
VFTSSDVMSWVISLYDATATQPRKDNHTGVLIEFTRRGGSREMFSAFQSTCRQYIEPEYTPRFQLRAPLTMRDEGTPREPPTGEQMDHCIRSWMCMADDGYQDNQREALGRLAALSEDADYRVCMVQHHLPTLLSDDEQCLARKVFSQSTDEQTQRCCAILMANLYSEIRGVRGVAGCAVLGDYHGSARDAAAAQAFADQLKTAATHWFPEADSSLVQCANYFSKFIQVTGRTCGCVCVCVCMYAYGGRLRS